MGRRVDAFWQDVRYGTRMLIRSARSTSVAVIALALGIGATTSIFTFVSVLVLRPFPFKDLDRTVVLWETRSSTGSQRYRVTPANFRDLTEQQRVFDELAAYRGWSAVLTGSGDPERVRGFRVSPELFSVLGMEALHGRTLRPVTDEPGRDDVVVLSFGFWQRRLGADPAVVGRTLTLNERKVTVVGVMPAAFEFPLGTDLWAPLALSPEEWGDRSAHSLRVIGRLRREVPFARAQASMSAIADRLAAEFPATNRQWDVALVPLREAVNIGSRRFLPMLLGAATFLLLLACFNVAHLQLDRASMRRREVAVRLSLGATRGRIVQLLLTESMLLSLVGGLLGLLLAVWGVDAMKASVPPRITRFIVAGLDDAGIDGGVLIFTFVATMLTGALSGLAPAIEASNPHLSATMAEGGRGARMGSRRRRLSSLLVVSEIALSIVLLVGAGLMVKGFRHLLSVDRGFNDEKLLTFRISLQGSRYTEGHQVTAFYDQILTRIRDVSDVASVAAVSNLPALGGTVTRDFTVEGRDTQAGDHADRVDMQVVSPDYFATLQIPLREGEQFTGDEAAESHRVAMVSEALAKRYWPGESSAGRRLKLGSAGSDAPWIDVIGVVGDVSRSWIDDQSWPTVYLPHRQSPSPTMSLVVRASSQPLDLVPAVRGQVQSADGDQPISNITTMRGELRDLSSGIRLAAALMAVFGGLAFLLCGAGIYALVSQAVTHRTHEVGVRIALGARRREVLMLFVGQGLRLAAIGVAIGLPAALALTYLLSGFLLGVVAIHPGTVAAFTLALVGVAVFASYLPAQRACRVDPMVALRYE